MRIAKVEAIPFRIPLHHPVRWATGYADVADHVIIRVHTDEGLVGQAEAVPRPSIYGESQVSIFHAVRAWLHPMLQGEHPLDLERIWTKLNQVANNQTAKGAVDLALHDIAAQAAGVPLWRYLGGATDRVPVTWMTHLKPPDEVAEEVSARAAEGLTMFKLKAGVDPAADVAMVRLIRQRLGDSVRLYLDANQGYTLPVALRVSQAVADLGVEFIEEPLPVGQITARQQFARAGILPVLGDDSCCSPADVHRELSAGTVQIISVKPPRTGAYLSRKVIALAEATGAPCLIGTQGESMLGTVASAHVGAAFSQFAYPGEYSLFTLLADDLLCEPLRFDQGWLQLPNRPGLGVEIDKDKLRHYRIDV